MPRLSVVACGGVQVAAFLDMIAYSELGSRIIQQSDDGYNVIVGSTPNAIDSFQSYAVHPNKRVYLPKINVWSTAAGRYQLLYRYYVAYNASLKLPDFSPESQDKIAIQQIKEQGAFNALQKGAFHLAVQRCANIWASLPGAGYGQHENKIELLAGAYRHAGGSIVTA